MHHQFIVFLKQQTKFLALMLLLISPLSSSQIIHKTSMSLDGDWQIIFDKENNSKQQQWVKNSNYLAHDNIRSIAVPSVWERIEKDYEGVAVYRKTFKTPNDWKSKVIQLQFDAVNYRAEVYLNDHVVGVHEGGFTPFNFRIDSMLNPAKENVLIVRVLGPILLDTDKVIDGMGAMETPQWRGGITGGIWQSVRLIATEKTFIDDIFIEPNFHDKKVKVTLSTINYDEVYHNSTVNLLIEDNDKVIITKTIKINFQPGNNKLEAEIIIPNAKSWSPNNPNLYKLTAQIESENLQSDSVTERFGLREFTVKNNRFHLNDEEIYVKAVFLEGVYPVGIATPNDMALARKEIRLAKEAGFNMIRPWRRPPPPAWLDLADEMGVMVIGSPALECMDLPVSTPELPKRVKFEIAQTIRRDRNRASVVMWELFNELRRPVLKQMMTETSMMARDTDPSRLILDESGGWAFGAKVYLPYERKFTYFNDVHTYPGPNVTNNWYDKFLGVGYDKDERKKLGLHAKPIGHNLKPNITSFVSELGYGSYVNFDKVNQQFESKGNPIVPPTRYHKQLGEQLTDVINIQLSTVYQSPAQFYNEQQEIHGIANARMIEATRANPNVTGYCVHALTGGDWIMGAGLLDLWRDPKPEVYDRTKAANQPQIVSIRAWPRNVYQGEEVRFTVTGINDLTSTDAIISVKITDQNNKTIWQNKQPFNYSKGVSSLLEQSIPSDKLSGEYIITASVLTNESKIITQNTHQFDVFDLPKKSTVNEIAIVDHIGSLTQFLKTYDIPFKTYSEDTQKETTVYVAMTDKPQDKQLNINNQLASFITNGGKVVYLKFPHQRPKWKNGVLGKGFTLNMPVDVKLKASQGLWAGMSHVVTKHPIFHELPVNKAMQGLYENIRPNITTTGINTSAIVRVVANDNFPDMTLMKRHYKGTGDVWTGDDIAKLALGQGQVWLSTLNLIPNLTKDPVADKVLLNLIHFMNQ